MNTLQQRLFRNKYRDAKSLTKKYKRDFVILFTNNPKLGMFKICTADYFFRKGIKFDKLICYLAHTETSEER